MQYHKNAITVPGPAIDRIVEIAKELAIFIVTGFIEQTPGTLCCSVGFFHPKDGFLYRRRKASAVASLVKPGLRILR